jgi:superfamily II DNA or RNA helicase
MGSNGILIPAHCMTKLYAHQREGVHWMWNAFYTHAHAGALIADDMGLGKTLQTCAFVASIQHRALVVVPMSVLHSWKTELEWCLREEEAPLCVHSSPPDPAAPAAGRRVWLTTFETVRLHVDAFRAAEPFDILIIDEAHRIKNRRGRTRAALESLGIPHRFLLTGTPIQNNALELFDLMNFVDPQLLMKKRSEFISMVDQPIRMSQERGADGEVQRAGQMATHYVHALIEPYFLRREKSVLQGVLRLPEKRDVMMWVRLTDAQINKYKRVLRTATVATDAFHLIATLKSICMHPRLADDADSISSAPLEDLVRESNKIRALRDLLPSMYAGGHRPIIFTHSLAIMTLLGRLLSHLGLSYCRLDGSTSSHHRQELVDAFNMADSPFFACILSMGVGAVGLTLTGADRVILLDPSWNPSLDAQAVDRAFRIGQTRNVVVYRFATCGSIEDKMMARQMSKGAVFEQLMNHNGTAAFFREDELRSIFRLERDLDTSMCVSSVAAKTPTAVLRFSSHPIASEDEMRALTAGGVLDAAIDVQTVFAPVSSAQKSPPASPVLPTDERASFHYFAATGDIDRLQEHHRINPASICECDEHGYTAFHYAAANGHVYTMYSLLLLGADPMATAGPRWNTPLHVAAQNGQVHAVQALIAMTDLTKALSMRNSDEKLPSALAAERGFHKLSYYIRMFEPKDAVTAEDKRCASSESSDQQHKRQRVQ